MDSKHSTAAASPDDKSSKIDVKASDSSVTKRIKFFAPNESPKLMDFSAISIINRYGSVEEAEKYINSDQFLADLSASLQKDQAIKMADVKAEAVSEDAAAKARAMVKDLNKPEAQAKAFGGGVIESEDSLLNQLRFTTQGILEKIKTLHRYVADNEVEKADELLTTIPRYLLPILLKTKSIVKTDAKGVSNHLTVRGTAYMMALGFQAVGRDGCDLVLMPPNSKTENSDSKKLSLHS